MRRPRGFALAAVLAVLVLMAMSLAVAAQRALVASHRAGVAEADAELAAALVGAQAAVVETSVAPPADTAWLPGGVLSAGEVRAGEAVAHWQVTRVSGELALAELTAERRLPGVVARTGRSALMAIVTDSVGRVGLRVLTPGGWVTPPSP